MSNLNLLERKIITTADGSSTLYIPQWDEHYHSKHGSIQEAYHVFIKNGFEILEQKNLSILEIGFGTGLNALLTFYESLHNNVEIDYTGIEAFPVNKEEHQALNYCQILKLEDCKNVFDSIFNATWDSKVMLMHHFSIEKKLLKFQEISFINSYDLIYFDAFGPDVQPELWTESIFKMMYQALKVKGVLVTYSAKGSVRRAMQEVGFQVEKLPGPPGKREMLRGIKLPMQ